MNTPEEVKSLVQPSLAMDDLALQMAREPERMLQYMQPSPAQTGSARLSGPDGRCPALVQRCLGTAIGAIGSAITSRRAWSLVVGIGAGEPEASTQAPAVTAVG